MQQTSSVELPARIACGIAVMAKASAPGRTKTRLVPPLTFEEAAALNTAFLQDVADNIVAASQHQSITGYVAFGPPGPQSTAFFRSTLPSDFGLLEAWHANFGECLYSAVAQMLDRGHSGAVVLNSDSPTLPTPLLVRTAELLVEPGDHAVLGPATDGGYYLLGVKRRHRRLFEEIDWSTERVVQQTLQRAGEIGLPVHMLPVWYDIDDLESLQRLRAELYAGPNLAEGHRSHRARHTAQLMGSLMTSADFVARMADLGDARLRGAAG